MRWLELSCRVDAEAVEAVAECFSRVAPAGVAIEPEILPGDDDGFRVGSRATVRAYIPVDGDSQANTSRLDASLGHLHAIWPVGDLLVKEVTDDDWANAWKAHYPVIRIGRRIVIRPTWIPYEPVVGEIVVSLDPGAAFGTGLHPTTNRCLQVLGSVVGSGDRILDVGTGSGILSIAAVALGAAEAFGVDVDDVAVSVARANVEVNGLSDKITIRTGSVDVPAPETRYNVVIANIIARVIIELAPTLVARLEPSGTLIVAGIIADRAADVSSRLIALGLSLRRFDDGDWVTYVGQVPVGG